MIETVLQDAFPKLAQTAIVVCTLVAGMTALVEGKRSNGSLTHSLRVAIGGSVAFVKVVAWQRLSEMFPYVQ